MSRYFRWASENHRLESLETLRDWITEESEYQLKLWKVLRGSELKQSTKETTVERIAPLPRLEEDEKKRLNFSENAIFVKVIMGYGRVSSLKMQMSMRDGESAKTRDYVFVVYVMHQSIPAVPIPPGPTPGISIFFFKWQIPGGGEK